MMTLAGSSALAAFSSSGSKACVRKNGDLTLIVMTLSQAVSGNVSIGSPHDCTCVVNEYVEPVLAAFYFIDQRRNALRR